MPKSKKSKLLKEDRLRLEQQEESERNAVEESLMSLDKNELRRMVRQLKDREPGLVLDLLQSAKVKTIAPRSAASPPWCICNYCVAMDSQVERKCCECSPDNCFSKSKDVQVMVLDTRVLALAKKFRNDLFGLHKQKGVDTNRSFRHTAYRQFVLMEHGRLSLGSRRVIPSCVVNAIRQKYPSKDGKYTGFSVERLT